MYAHADAFESYSGGVITDKTRYSGITHVVNVVGWGVDTAPDGTEAEHWIVRNSFGTQWGEYGYYRQRIGLDVYNMESHDCAWATPDPGYVAKLVARSGM